VPRLSLEIEAASGCCFPKDAERTYDRSFAHFAKLVAAGRV